MPHPTGPSGVLRGCLMVSVLLFLPGRGQDPRLPGYSAAASQAEVDWETRFRAVPEADSLRELLRRLSARPHHTGSPQDRENAESILGRFKAWGLDAHIETFDVLFPTPKVRLVELTVPRRYVARLQEPAVATDPTSAQAREQLPTYNAYSIDGDVTGPLVYVNYGVPADYQRLDRLGISVKGAIVIARYGGSWRGIKPKVAAEHGALGCLIYSDPVDDGYYQGEVFPQGPWRPRDGVQRGSVMDMPLRSGDPLTPGIGATKDAKRLPLSEVDVLTRIPVLPISYGDAQPLLAALGGPVAPREWRGALPFTYHIGAGPATVHLKVQSNWDVKTIYDVIATIPGAVEPDQWIIRGNHHDGWVNGTDDPLAGQVALLEEARGLATLLRQGWKPRRTIVYAAWDAEEQGLMGSTEWVETHAEELRQHAAVYINTDGNGRGFLRAGGSHTLEPFINGVARDIEDPETHLSVWKRAQLQRIRTGTAEQREEARRRDDLRIDALGSGSDFSPFLQHAGVASLNLGFDGESDGGVYHSIYDDFYWYTHFADTSFVYGRALAQLVGTAVLRLADAEVLPFDFASLSETVGRYKDELERLLGSERDSTEEQNRELDEGAFTATADPWLTSVPPSREAVPPRLNFAPLENAVDSLARSADRYRKSMAAAGQGDGAALTAASRGSLNQKLLESERRLLLESGLPGRPWYRHQLYAPGLYTGYGVKTVPAIREAIEHRDWDIAQTAIEQVAGVLRGEAALIEEAATELGQARSGR